MMAAIISIIENVRARRDNWTRYTQQWHACDKDLAALVRAWIRDGNKLRGVK